jgi:hypothetical protein
MPALPWYVDTPQPVEALRRRRPKSIAQVVRMARQRAAATGLTRTPRRTSTFSIDEPGMLCLTDY